MGPGRGACPSSAAGCRASPAGSGAAASEERGDRRAGRRDHADEEKDKNAGASRVVPVDGNVETCTVKAHVAVRQEGRRWPCVARTSTSSASRGTATASRRSARSSAPARPASSSGPATAIPSVTTDRDALNDSGSLIHLTRRNFSAPLLCLLQCSHPSHDR